MIETVQNILSASPDELAGAQTESGATSRAIASLEDQLFLVDVTASNGTFTRVEDNLAVQVVITTTVFIYWQTSMFHFM